MTTTTHSTVKRRTTAPLLISAALVGILTLTGCTPDAPTPTNSPTATDSTPTPTPTPTESGVSAPQTEDEAVKAAQTLVEQFIDISNSVATDGGQNPDRLAVVAANPALQEQLSSAKAIADNGYVITGESTLEVQTSYAGDLTDAGTTVPFGSVTIQGCYDSTDRSVRTADGADAPQPPDLRTIRDVNVIYSPADSAWFVRTFIKVDSAC